MALDGVLSDNFLCMTGVRQGENLSPCITTYQDGCCSRILLFGFLGPVRDVSVAFVIRRGGAPYGGFQSC